MLCYDIACIVFPYCDLDALFIWQLLSHKERKRVSERVSELIGASTKLTSYQTRTLKHLQISPRPFHLKFMLERKCCICKERYCGGLYPTFGLPAHDTCVRPLLVNTYYLREKVKNIDEMLLHIPFVTLNGYIRGSHLPSSMDSRHSTYNVVWRSPHPCVPLSLTAKGYIHDAEEEELLPSPTPLPEPPKKKIKREKAQWASNFESAAAQNPDFTFKSFRAANNRVPKELRPYIRNCRVADQAVVLLLQVLKYHNDIPPSLRSLTFIPESTNERIEYIRDFHTQIPEDFHARIFDRSTSLLLIQSWINEIVPILPQNFARKCFDHSDIEAVKRKIQAVEQKRLRDEQMIQQRKMRRPQKTCCICITSPAAADCVYGLCKHCCHKKGEICERHSMPRH